MGGAARLEPLPDEIEHLDELAEDEDAMPAVDDFFEQFIEQIELGRGFALVVRQRSEQTQVAAGLAEPEQTGQYLHPRAPSFASRYS